MSRGHQTRKAASLSTRWFGNRSGFRCPAAWVAATLVWGDATETLTQRQSPSAENAASEAAAETPGGRRALAKEAIIAESTVPDSTVGGTFLEPLLPCPLLIPFTSGLKTYIPRPNFVHCKAAGSLPH